MPELIETRGQALDFLNSRIDYERTATVGSAARCFKLERMQQLLERLENPQQRIPAVHIAGTKGKGSTAIMVAEMLLAGGYRTGLFTSPHIHDFEERMRVDGVQPSESELVDVANRVHAVVTAMDTLSDAMRPTYFEIATAMAWLFFAVKQADIVVLEVGLGGRLDATNLCRPVATVITSISFDHTAVLGTSLAAIAGEKGGIVKRDIPLISGVVAAEPRQVIREICEKRSAPLYELGNDISIQRCTERSVVEETAPESRQQQIDIETPWRYWPDVKVPLRGEHQTQNAALAVAVVDLLDKEWRPISTDAAREGLARVRWPLRVEVIGRQPTIIADAAHNVASAKALLSTLESDFPAERSLLVFAATRDKDFGGMLEQLHCRFETIILTTYTNNPRGVPADRVADVLSERCGRTATIAADPVAAWEIVRHQAAPGDLVCITGSLFLAAEMREIILGDRDDRNSMAVTPERPHKDSPAV